MPRWTPTAFHLKPSAGPSAEPKTNCYHPTDMPPKLATFFPGRLPRFIPVTKKECAMPAPLISTTCCTGPHWRFATIQPCEQKPTSAGALFWSTNTKTPTPRSTPLLETYVRITRTCSWWAIRTSRFINSVGPTYAIFWILNGTIQVPRYCTFQIITEAPATSCALLMPSSPTTSNANPKN